MKGIMKKIICWFLKHKRGKTTYKDKTWHVECKRCGYWIEYKTAFARLISIELEFGFTGE